MKTDLLEIRESRTLNIGLKLFLLDKICVNHLLKLHFLDCKVTWTASVMSLRERERERWVKTERQADGFTLLIIKFHL